MGRHLHPKLKAWLNERIKPVVGPEAEGYREGLTPTELLLLTASMCLDIREVGAENHGEIVEFLQSTIARPQGEPWCAAFIQSCVAYVEETMRVVSPLFPSELCVEMFLKSPHTVGVPMPGDLVVWRFEGTPKGHVGIIEKLLRRPTGEIKGYATIEGNTGSGESTIVREGDGVYRRTRPRGGIGVMKEIGIIRPFPQPLPLG